MTQQVKVLVTKPDDPTSIPKTHKVEKKNQGWKDGLVVKTRATLTEDQGLNPSIYTQPLNPGDLMLSPGL